VRLWADVVSKSPHKLRPYNRLIFGYMQRGDLDKALSVANTGLDNVPRARVAFLDTIGNLYLKMGRPDKAVPYFADSTQEAVRIGMTGIQKAGYFNNLGIGYMALAQVADQKYRPIAWRRAQNAFAISIDASNKDVRTLDSYVSVSHLLGDGPQLEQEFLEILKTDPNNFRGMYSVGLLLSLDGRYAESVHYFEQAEPGFYRTTPGTENFFFNYALALSKAGQTDNAIQKYLIALGTDPDFSEAHYNLALLYTAKQDYGSAIQHLTEVLGKEPGHTRANVTLARIYASQGKWLPARDHLQKVLQMDPQNPQAMALLQQLPIK
jgi:tetratricopeptide (TPR) repeat protein